MDKKEDSIIGPEEISESNETFAHPSYSLEEKDGINSQISQQTENIPQTQQQPEKLDKNTLDIYKPLNAYSQEHIADEAGVSTTQNQSTLQMNQRPILINQEDAVTSSNTKISMQGKTSTKFKTEKPQQDQNHDGETRTDNIKYLNLRDQSYLLGRQNKLAILSSQNYELQVPPLSTQKHQKLMSFQNSLERDAKLQKTKLNPLKSERKNQSRHAAAVRSSSGSKHQWKSKKAIESWQMTNDLFGPETHSQIAKFMSIEGKEEFQSEIQRNLQAPKQQSLQTSRQKAIESIHNPLTKIQKLPLQVLVSQETKNSQKLLGSYQNKFKKGGVSSSLDNFRSQGQKISNEKEVLQPLKGRSAMSIMQNSKGEHNQGLKASESEVKFDSTKYQSASSNLNAFFDPKQRTLGVPEIETKVRPGPEQIVSQVKSIKQLSHNVSSRNFGDSEFSQRTMPLLPSIQNVSKIKFNGKIPLVSKPSKSKLSVANKHMMARNHSRNTHSNQLDKASLVTAQNKQNSKQSMACPNMDNLGSELDSITRRDKKTVDEENLLQVDLSQIPNLKSRLVQMNIEHQFKVDQCDHLLNGIIDKVKEDYLLKGHLQSREQIEKQIIAEQRKHDKTHKLNFANGRVKKSSVMSSKLPSDFELLKLKKIKHYVDHQGNYITKTGQKIDNYAIGDATHTQNTFVKLKQEYLSQRQSKKRSPLQRCKTKSDLKKFVMHQLEASPEPKKDFRQYQKKRQSRNSKQFVTKLKTQGREQIQELIGAQDRSFDSREQVGSSDSFSVNESEESSSCADQTPQEKIALAKPSERSPLLQNRMSIAKKAEYSSSQSSHGSQSPASPQKKSVQKNLRLFVQETIAENQRQDENEGEGEDDHETAQLMLVSINQRHGLSLSQVFEKLNSISSKSNFKEQLNSYDQQLVQTLCIDESFDMRFLKTVDPFKQYRLKSLIIQKSLSDSDLASILKRLFLNTDSRFDQSTQSDLLNLRINLCEIGGESFACIESMLVKNKNLKDFEISQCKMTSKITNEISKLFVEFDFSNKNGWNGEQSPQASFPGLRKAQSIQSPDGLLCESPSPLKGKISLQHQTQAQQILEEALDEQAHQQVKSIRKLQRLSLSGLKMQGQGLNLKVLIEQSNNLTKLDISFNHFKLYQIESILVSILKAKNLRFLNVSHNKMNSEKCQRILEELIKYSWTLIDLDISFTQILRPYEILEVANKHSLSLQCLHMDGLIQQKQRARDILQIESINVKRSQGADLLSMQESEILGNSLKKTLSQATRSPNRLKKAVCNLINQNIQTKRSTSQENHNSKIKEINLFASNPEDRLVYQRVVGHPIIRVFDFIESYMVKTGYQPHRNSAKQNEQLLTCMLQQDLWPNWQEQDSCRICHQQRFCIILYYNAEANADAGDGKKYESNIKIVHLKNESWMVPVSTLMKSLCHSTQASDESPDQWLSHLYNEFYQFSPLFVYNQRPRESIASLFDIENWFCYINFFPIEQRHVLEIKIQTYSTVYNLCDKMDFESSYGSQGSASESINDSETKADEPVQKTNTIVFYGVKSHGSCKVVPRILDEKMRDQGVRDFNLYLKQSSSSRTKKWIEALNDNYSSIESSEDFQMADKTQKSQLNDYNSNKDLDYENMIWKNSDYPLIKFDPIIKNLYKQSFLEQITVKNMMDLFYNSIQNDLRMSVLSNFSNLKHTFGQQELSENFNQIKFSKSNYTQVICESFYYLQLQNQFDEKIWPGIKKQTLVNFLIKEINLKVSAYKINFIIQKVLVFDATQKMQKGLKQFFRHFQGAHQKEVGKKCPYKHNDHRNDSSDEAEEVQSLIHRHHFIDILFAIALDRPANPSKQTDSDRPEKQPRLSFETICQFMDTQFIPRWKQKQFGCGVTFQDRSIVDYRNKFILNPENDFVLNQPCKLTPGATYKVLIREIFTKLTIDRAKQRVTLGNIIKFCRRTFDQEHIGSATIFQCFIRSKGFVVDQEPLKFERLEQFFITKKIASQEQEGYPVAFPENSLNLQEFCEFLIRLSKFVAIQDTSVSNRFEHSGDFYVFYKFLLHAEKNMY